MRYRWHGPHGEVIEVIRKIDDRDVPPTPEEIEELGYNLAPKDFSRRPEAPIICWRHDPAYGKRRFERDPTLRDLNEASKIEQEMFNLPDSERAPLQKEIDRLKGTDDE